MQVDWSQLSELMLRDPVLVAFAVLAEGPPGWAGSPIQAIGWSAEQKVLSIYRASGDWVNLWLESSVNNGEPYAERNNGAAADTVILWANHPSTYRHLERQGYASHLP